MKQIENLKKRNRKYKKERNEKKKKNEMLTLKLSSTITEVKNSLDRFSNLSRLDIIQESNSEKEDKSREAIHSEEHRGKKIEEK